MELEFDTPYVDDYTRDQIEVMTGRPYETLPTLDSQPFQAFVDVYIADHVFTKIPPQYLRSFRVERTSEGANSFTFMVTDRYGDEVEETLHHGFSHITFRYGHITGRQSRMFNGMLTDYSLLLGAAGTNMTVQGLTVGIRDNLEKVTMQVAGATPDQAFLQICEKLGWVPGRVDPALPIKDHSYSSSYSKEEEDKNWNLIDENPALYIQTYLIPRAIRSKDGLGGYQFYLDDSTSPPTAHFHCIDINPGTERTYIYKKGINTSVISFETSIKGIFGGVGEGVATTYAASYLDPTTKDVEELTYDIESNPETPVTGEGTHTRHGLKKLTLSTGGMSKSEVSSVLNYRFNRTFNNHYEAMAILVGDPTIQPFETIRMLVITDQGTLHHTSGVYLIKKVVDVIDAGIMKTELQLQRNADLYSGVEVVRSDRKVR